MGKHDEQVDEQVTFNFCLEPTNYVVQANTLIGGKQNLNLNSAKFIRSAIMQVVREDEELKPYVVTIRELAKLLEVSPENLYRDVEAMIKNIRENPVYIKRADGKRIRWIDYPWYSRCEYNSAVGISIQLNPYLKPLLLKLKQHYTQYMLKEILAMKSIYAIRIFEIIQSRIMSRAVPKKGAHVVLAVQEIRECCSCEDKLLKFNHFKTRVLDFAVKEINRTTMYTLSYTYVKNGRSVEAIDFFIKSKLC